jgi:3-isopropylmalate dehydrogenase
MLLRYSLGLSQEADAIEAAVGQCINAGYRTEDLREEGKEVLGTKEMGRRIASAVARITV